MSEVSHSSDELEQLPVCGGGWLALTWALLRARWEILRSGAGGEHLEWRAYAPLNGATNAEWLPLGWILQTVRFSVAARVNLGVALRLNPHLVTGEQAKDALLSWLWSCTAAVNAL
jgi:hypothetical protein